MLLVLRCWRSVTHVTETGKLSTDKDVFPLGHESWFIVFSPVLYSFLASIATLRPVNDATEGSMQVAHMCPSCVLPRIVLLGAK